jgi:hypothetical protein
VSPNSILQIVVSIWNSRASLGSAIKPKEFIFMYLYSLLPDCFKKNTFKTSRAFRRFENAERKF